MVEGAGSPDFFASAATKRATLPVAGTGRQHIPASGPRQAIVLEPSSFPLEDEDIAEDRRHPVRPSRFGRVARPEGDAGIDSTEKAARGVLSGGLLLSGPLRSRMTSWVVPRRRGKGQDPWSTRRESAKGRALSRPAFGRSYDRGRSPRSVGDYGAAGWVYVGSPSPLTSITASSARVMFLAGQNRWSPQPRVIPELKSAST